MATLRGWLQDCESNHTACHSSPKGYPKRILDVTEGKHLRLAARTEIQSNEHPIRYATLSHAWGNHVPMRTTKKTQPEFEQSIPEELLPRTFRDAISITRSLGIRYLWVDSLCIIQDDLEDWQAEALEMKDIYAGSTINIAASYAVDGTGGCLGEEVGIADDATDAIVTTKSGSGTKSPRVFAYHDKQESRSNLIRVQARAPQQLQKSTHLSTRGWVLQEELLSHRIVHCLKSEIYWQCRCVYKTQAGQVFRRQQDFEVAPEMRIERRERQWYDWMEDYSRRDFTVPSDRVAAQAGVSSHYRYLTGFSPMLGIWKESFVTGLLWIRLGRSKVTERLGIPSWTWLSCNAPVRFDYWGRLSMIRGAGKDHAILKSFDVTWTGLAGVSGVQSASLVISGHLQDLRLRIAPGSRFNPPFISIEGEALDLSTPIPWSCAGQFDEESIPRRDFNSYTCLLLRTKAHFKTFLVLERAEGFSGDAMSNLLTFRRIGIASISGNNKIFSSLHQKDIILC